MAQPESHVQDLAEPLRHLLLNNHPRAVRFAIVLWAVALSLFVAMAIPSARNAIDAFDRQIFDLTFGIKWAPVTAIAYALDFLGSSLFVWPLRVVVSGYFIWTTRWRRLATWLLAIALSEPFIGLLKLAYGRARPPQPLVEVVSGSFPSGHSTVGAVVAVSLVVCFAHAGPTRRNLEIGAASFAFLMGGSRIYLGAHWFTDVVSGVALGAACAIAAAAIVQWFTDHRKPTTEPVPTIDQ